MAISDQSVITTPALLTYPKRPGRVNDSSAECAADFATLSIATAGVPSLSRNPCRTSGVVALKWSVGPVAYLGGETELIELSSVASVPALPIGMRYPAASAHAATDRSGAERLKSRAAVRTRRVARSCGDKVSLPDALPPRPPQPFAPASSNRGERSWPPSQQSSWVWRVAGTAATPVGPSPAAAIPRAGDSAISPRPTAGRPPTLGHAGLWMTQAGGGRATEIRSCRS